MLAQAHSYREIADLPVIAEMTAIREGIALIGDIPLLRDK
jgi:hypothetical protein